MSSAIEVLKRLVKEEGLKMSGNEMIYFNKDEFNTLKEALLALEINESLINDLLLLANIRADDTITGNEIISCLLKNKVNIVQGKDFIWEKVGEQK